MNTKFLIPILFILPCLIWSSTWFAIQYQVNDGDPLVCVSYRFIVSGILLLIYCLISKRPTKFTYEDHFWFILMGALLSGLNYGLIYWAKIYLSGGLIAIAYSSLVFLNSSFSRIFLKTRLNWVTIVGGIIGLLGMSLIFGQEWANLKTNGTVIIAILACILAVVLCSLGNVVSAYLQKKRLPLIQSTAYSMVYGGALMGLMALFLQKDFSINFSFSFTISFLYLTIFGSIVAFLSYLKLIGLIGVDRAAYIALVYPVLALIISSFLDQLVWTWLWTLGSVIIVISGVIILKSKPG